MRFVNAVIAYDKDTGKIEIGSLHDGRSWSDPFPTNELLLLAIMTRFHEVVVEGGVDPQDAHREFNKIGEYREFTSPGIKAVEQPPFP